MAKSSKKSGKKASKVKNDNNGLLKDINKKVTSTKKELQKQVDDLTAQIIKIRKEATQPAKKWLKDTEKKYEKMLSKQQKAFEEKAESLLASKDKLINQLKEELLGTKPEAKKTPPKKAAPKTTARRANPTKPGIAQLKGVGPATVKKLNAAGINSLEDLVNAEPEKLASFKAIRGSDTWIQQAKGLLEK